jgi:hypothetical protein
MSVVGPGTPDGPASWASILPIFSGMAVFEPPQVAIDETTPLRPSVFKLDGERGILPRLYYHSC